MGHGLHSFVGITWNKKLVCVFMNGLQCRLFFFRPAKHFSENWPKSAFEIVVRVEKKKISAVNVPNGVTDVPIGTS